MINKNILNIPLINLLIILLKINKNLNILQIFLIIILKNNNMIKQNK